MKTNRLFFPEYKETIEIQSKEVLGYFYFYFFYFIMILKNNSFLLSIFIYKIGVWIIFFIRVKPEFKFVL